MYEPVGVACSLMPEMVRILPEDEELEEDCAYAAATSMLLYGRNLGNMA